MSHLLRLVAVAILVVSLTLMIGPFGNVEAASGVWDKGAHFVVFGLILWSLGVLFRRLPRTVAALLALALGGAVEVVQGLVGRDASWGDLLADALGIAVALLLWAVWRGFRPRAAFQTSNTR
ncbi:VanZ family protein [Brevundimonas viscosa]|uniref:VanZ like family protein n=1 Tax=Brevundimonas viscosa TaxID=871741 RepID=A0A1I6NS55_9CAUL|nr:VanZ family protein [Brevundimonas viscosa]SFS30734.1 VanZ like family protein [Brevundimonas viscosa]